MFKLPSVTSNVSKNKSSNLTRAKASSTSKPKVNALMKSAAFWSELISFVSGHVYIELLCKIKCHCA